MSGITGGAPAQAGLAQTMLALSRQFISRAPVTFQRERAGTNSHLTQRAPREGHFLRHF